MRIGFYAGSFDPFTKGHLHVVKQAAKLFDKVIVGIGVNGQKTRRFDEEKMKEGMIKTFENEGLTNIEVVSYNNLSVDVAKKYNANFLIRGIRNGVDYSYEENLAEVNEEISGLDTIYVRAGKLGVISSSMVAELLHNGKSVDNYLTKEIQEVIKN